jgi:hypothetical protein
MEYILKQKEDKYRPNKSNRSTVTIATRRTKA